MPVLLCATTWTITSQPESIPRSTNSRISASMSSASRGGAVGPTDPDRRRGDPIGECVIDRRARLATRSVRSERVEVQGARGGHRAATDLVGRGDDVEERAVVARCARCTVTYSASVPDGVSTTSTRSSSGIRSAVSRRRMRSCASDLPSAGSGPSSPAIVVEKIAGRPKPVHGDRRTRARAEVQAAPARAGNRSRTGSGPSRGRCRAGRSPPVASRSARAVSWSGNIDRSRGMLSAHPARVRPGWAR